MKTEGKEGKKERWKSVGKVGDRRKSVMVKVVEWTSESSAGVARKTNGQRLGGLKGREKL